MDTDSQQHVFLIEGMDCAACARTVEQGVRSLPGVTTCELNFTSARLTLTGSIDPAAVVARVRALGYDVTEPDRGAPPAATGSFWHYMGQRTTSRLALLGLLLILPSVILHELLGIEHPLIDLAALLALLLAGTPIARSAWQALRVNRTITINMLMTIAAIGAVIIGAYTEAGLVMVLFALGEALEGYTSRRARDSLRSLMAVMPATATLLRRASPAADHELQPACCGDSCCSDTAAVPTLQTMPIESLQVGDVVLVRPGERIPMDGRVLAGESSVNQAPLTGESRLIDKHPGEPVLASSINGAGALEVEVTHLAADNTISRMIRLVEAAQEQRALTQRFIDRFASYYTPLVVGLAVLIATVPPLLFGQPFWNSDPATQGWFYRALALLIVACPCALVISTPVSIVSAISNAARQGILMKGGVYLEQLSRVRAIAFDKTGTLTTGTPTVIETHAAVCPNVCPLTACDACAACDDLLALASAVEQQSEHPLGRAIVAAADLRKVQHRYLAASGVMALIGQGVVGEVAGQQILLGSHRVFDERIAHPDTHCTAAHRDAAAGYTPVLVSVDNTYIGRITVADTVRATSRQAISQLKQLGVPHLIMLTGDTATTAEQIAQQVGVSEVRAELLPDQKVAAVHELQRAYGQVAMVGDGINDAPALAAADVSIALGGQAGGTAQAMETADMVLMRDDLRLLPHALRLSRATMQTIQTNIVIALGSKLLFLVLVLLGMGSLWLAVLADMGASLLVTLYGMRLLRWQPYEPDAAAGRSA